jgi:hypothetical protein
MNWYYPVFLLISPHCSSSPLNPLTPQHGNANFSLIKLSKFIGIISLKPLYRQRSSEKNETYE